MSKSQTVSLLFYFNPVYHRTIVGSPRLFAKHARLPGDKRFSPAEDISGTLRSVTMDDTFTTAALGAKRGRRDEREAKVGAGCPLVARLATSVILCQQSRRRWKPKALAHLPAHFSDTDEIRYEPWTEMGLSGDLVIDTQRLIGSLDNGNLKILPRFI